MRCPFLINQYGNPKSCEKNYCALWDDEREQCAIKSFLIPNNKNKIAPPESPSVEEMKELFMKAIQSGQIKGVD